MTLTTTGAALGEEQNAALLPKPPPPRPQHAIRIYWLPVILCTMILMLIDVGSFLAAAPQLRLFESIICRQYYDTHAPALLPQNGNVPGNSMVPEKLCKITPVQDAVAQLNGWQALFDNIPGLLFAIPYGVLADTIGRKVVLVMNIAGLSLATAWVLFVCWFELPIRLSWLSSAFYCIGGGNQLGGTLILMIVTDATPEENRSTIFFQTQASIIIAEMIAPPLAAVLMARNVWIPLFLSFACGASCIFIAMLLPETRSWLSNESEPQDEFVSDPRWKQNPGRKRPSPEQSGKPKTDEGSLFGRSRQTLSFIFQDVNLALLVTAFLISTFGRQSMSFILQYVSKRYGWPLAKTSYLLSFRASAQLVLFVLVLPGISKLVVGKFSMSNKVKDLALTRLSILVTMIGFAAIAVAPSVALLMVGLALYTFGTGFGTFARSLSSSLTKPTQIGALYTAMSVMDTIGSLLAGPSLALAFKWGMHLGGFWLGMPFLWSTALCGMVACMIYAVRLPPEQSAGEEESEDLF
ncbi:hypothetical protein MMC08_009169, partial [Hypocenomyce scalaris]|nr:hypothetical protein [Hypocenomyce scalaris]